MKLILLSLLVASSASAADFEVQALTLPSEFSLNAPAHGTCHAYDDEAYGPLCDSKPIKEACEAQPQCYWFE